ncbi:hypothetical protein ENUP19_0139G0022 [Entamoeba nuttalli]|uniref:Ribosome biogenesis protein, putative n=2 Tax=Entamoeba nuttalli TaxID=412467 RepID=K2HYM8_ENTNP|nr:ribosome biogenesis protein, putative [Entamoeba nuttalli P19]EKE41520.1 ribosome biogenesis protein, putative [Entamoeba nuttalli P19]|eukprot:XP_008856146.1 ribosome biogenesis protein, putative [Entamoeba nuttalli P19]
MDRKKDSREKEQVKKPRRLNTLSKRKKEMASIRRKRRELIKEGKIKPQQPQTLETKRIKDDSFVDFKNDEEAVEEIKNDEYSAYYKGREPKIIVTSTIAAHSNTKKFAYLLSRIFYNAQYFERKQSTMHKIINYAKRNDYTDIIVCNDNHKECTDLYIIHMPCGPSFHFKLFNLMKPKDIKGHVTVSTWHVPCECLTTGFQTRLGVMVARQLNALFSQKPNFKGRRVVTFHSQRDFIFFRHHIYQFDEAKDNFDRAKGPVKCLIDELGPRFILKLRSIQRGTMNTVNPEYIYFRNIDKSNPDDTSKSKFML